MNIKQQRDAALKAAHSILFNPDGTTRTDLASADVKRANDHMAEVKRLDEHIKQAAASDAIMARLEGHGADPDGTDRQAGGLVGLKDGLAAAVRTKGSYGFNMPFKKEAAATGPLNLPSQGTGVSQAPIGAAVVALRELLHLETVDTGHVRYYTITAGSGADVVPELGLKPELNTAVTPKDEALKKIAVRFQFSDELAEDAGFLVSFIQAEAMRAVLLRENALVVDALDAATGVLTSDGSAADAVDVIAGAIGAAQASNGLTPARLVVNPLDLAAIRTLKAAGSGEYAIDPLSAATTSVHGVPITATPAVPAKRMYLVTEGVGTFYAHRSGLRVETGLSGDDFDHNRISTRVEERVLPVVVQPTLLTRITLT